MKEMEIINEVETTRVKHKLGEKLYVEHLPLAGAKGKVAEHTYLVAEDNKGLETHWAAFGRADGGKLLMDTLIDQKSSIDIDSVNYMMTKAPCMWPKNPFYAVVGVCWNACNRGLYFTHKTVHNIKHYHAVEMYYGTYGLDDDSWCWSKIAKKGRKLYSWTKALEAIRENCPWQGMAINQNIMAKSENSRIRLYHEYFGDTAHEMHKALNPETRWKQYLQDLNKLHLEDKLPNLHPEKIVKIQDIHANRLEKMHAPNNIDEELDHAMHVETHLNELLDECKTILTDEEYKELFNADKDEIFVLPTE